MHILLALALLAPIEDWEKERDALNKAVSGLDRAGVDKAVAALVKLNDEHCLEVFLGAFRAGLIQTEALEKERQKLAKEMEKVEPQRDKEGRIIKGDNNKYVFLRRDYDLLVMKIDILNGALPRIVSHIADLTTLKQIIAALNATPEWYPRACCVEALARIDKPEALAALLARAKTEDSAGVKVALCDAFASKTKQNEDVRKAVLPWLDSSSWQVRLAAAQALAKTEDVKLVPVFIKLLQGASARMKYEINEILKKLTRADRHGDFAAWTTWWEKHDNEVLGGTYQPSPADRADMAPVTMFYGIPVHSSKIVFIIDVSLSMKEPATWKPEIIEKDDKLEGDRGIDIARYELRKLIKGLPDGANYNVIGMYGRLAMLSEKWTVQGKTSREAALKFVKDLEVKSGTDLHGAYMRALDFSGGNWNTPPKDDSIDTIFILTDGVPSVGLAPASQIPDRVLDAARFKRIAITSIAIDAPKEGRELLKKISEGTGGLYVVR